MARSIRKYMIEVRQRTCYEGTAFGTVDRFLYTDKEGQSWVKVSGEWHPLDRPLEDAHVFVQEFPRDLCTAGYA